MDNAVLRLEQKHFRHGRQILILDGNTLKVEHRRGLSLQEYRFNLRDFSPDPIHMKRVPVGRIAGVVLLTALGATLVVAGFIISDIVMMARLLLVGLLLISFGGVAYLPIPHQMMDVFLFQGVTGQLALWADRPNPEELGRFLAALSARIRNAQHTGEDLLKQLRRAEIIDDWTYEQAMSLLEQNGEGTATQ